MMINEIKSRINCIDYARRCGLPVAKAGDRCISPLRPDAKNRSSFVVYEDFFYDFGSSMGGDVIDLCAYLKYGGDKSEAVKELARITGASGDNTSYAGWAFHVQNTCSLIAKWHEALRPQDIDYLRSRRISDETIKRLKIGYTGEGYVAVIRGSAVKGFAKERISVPYWKNGYVFSWSARALSLEQEPKYLKPPNTDYSDLAAVWGVHTLDRESRCLVIAEGTFDALSFEQEGYPVLATMGGEFSKYQLSTIAAAAKNFDYVLLTFDSDQAGDRFTVKLAKFLFSRRIKFKVASLPEGFKDVSDYYSAGLELSTLVSRAEEGLIALCKAQEDKESFKAFALNACRFIGKPETAELFKAAAVSLPEVSPEWLKELKKQCMGAPSEDYIAGLVVKTHDMKYFSGLGFYEYRHGVYEHLDDETVHKYIADELGCYRRGSLVTNIIKLIKADCISKSTFNELPVFNFINGTLHLDTMEFKPHDPSDLCSFQVDYPYLPNSDCPEWEKFIGEICDGDVKRMNLLQELAGYVLFSENSLQSCAFLLGSGSNGKSVYLNVLTRLFGEEQVTNVEMSSLTDNFQKILLRSSLLNVSTETRSDVRGTESVFKQIVAGDRISGCYKNKDFVDFKPRCKMMFACNEIPRVSDSSFGMNRRMTFINFVNRYLDHPDPNDPHQFRKDEGLTERLLKELPGIMNWTLVGYNTLKACGSFTVTDDAEKLMSDFKEAASPISIFINDCPVTDSVTNEELYDSYKQWCHDNGYQNVKTRPAFIRAYKQQKPSNIVEYRTHNSVNRTIRGFRRTDTEMIGEVVQDIVFGKNGVTNEKTVSD